MSTYPRTFSHIGISVPDVEKAAVLVAQARFDGKAQFESAEVRIDFSERKQKRSLELYEKNYVSEYNLDEAATEKVLAEKALLEAEEARRLAAAELERAKAFLELKSIRSPFTGVVVVAMATCSRKFKHVTCPSERDGTNVLSVIQFMLSSAPEYDQKRLNTQFNERMQAS